MARGALQVVRDRIVVFEAELGFDELRDGGGDAAELGMAERVLAAGLGEEPAVGVVRAFRDDDDAVLVLRRRSL